MNQIARHHEGPREAYLTALGERVRAIRHRRAMTRKRLAEAAGVSERHLANLETGQGNASVMLLRDLARALGTSIAELVGEESLNSGEWTRIREMLRGRDEAALARARKAVAEALGATPAGNGRELRVALIGLRGAGKSTLGRMLAEDIRVPFIELDRLVERMAGCDVGEIHSLYGAAAFRRYELRALEDTIATHERAVIATGGGLVTEPSTYELLLRAVSPCGCGVPRRPHEAGHRPRRPAADGRERRSDGGPEADPRGTRGRVRAVGPRVRHQRATAGAGLRRFARRHRRPLAYRSLMHFIA